MISRLLRERKEELLADWEQAVRAQGHLEGKGMDRPALVDAVPALLERAADRAEAQARGRPPPGPGPEARRHAVRRPEHGYDLGEALTEFALLRQSVVRRCREEAPELGPGELEVLHRVIDEAMISTASRFARAREQTLQALDRISAVALSSPEADSLLQRLLGVFQGAIPVVDTVAFLLLDGDRLHLRATLGLEEEQRRGFSLAVGEGFAGRVAAERRPLLLREAATDPLVRSEVLRARGTRALHGVPLEYGGRLLGVAHMGSSKASEFSEDDLLLFRAMAERAVSAIAHAEDITREQVEHAVARVLAAASSLEEALPRLLAAVGATCGWRVGSAWLFDATAQVLRLHSCWKVASVRAHAFEELSRRVEFRPGEGLPGRALRTGKVTWISDVALDPGFPRKAAALQEGLRSAVALPLRGGAGVLGVLEFFSDRLRSPAEALVRMTTLLGERLADFQGRLQAQEQVRRGEAQHAAILEAALDCIVSIDAQDRVVGWNPAAERTFGYARQEALGRDMADLIIPPHLREAHRRGFAHYLATGEERYFNRRLEMSALRKDGMEFPVELIITRIPVPGPPVFTGHLRDITKRRRAEQALRISESRYRLATVATSDAIWDWNLETDGLEWSAGVQKLFGYPLAEVRPDVTWWYEHIHPDDRDRVVHGIHAVIDGTGDGWEDEYRFRHRDGSYVLVTDHGAIERDARGKGVRMVGAMKDVTVLKAIQEALQRSEREFRTVTEAMPQFVWTARQDGQLDYVNPRLAQYLGERAAAFLASAWEEVIHPEDVSAFKPVWARAVATGEPFQAERRLRRNDGIYRWFLTRGVAIRDEQGRVRKWLGTSTDIDDLKCAEAELRRRSEAEQQLIGIVSHDLRNPLSSILLSTQALLRSEDLTDRQARTVIRLHMSAERATRLIRDLLDFTKARLGGGILIERKPLDFHEAVRNVLVEVRAAHPERAIELRSSGDGQGAWDEDRLAQVVTNLVNNALAYSPPETVVRVETRGEAQGVSLSVHNAGTPIPPDVLPQLFKPMRRGTGVGGATDSIGLGLFIVESIVRAHAGDIEVRSTAEEGTTFRVVLPRAPA